MGNVLVGVVIIYGASCAIVGIGALLWRVSPRFRVGLRGDRPKL